MKTKEIRELSVKDLRERIESERLALDKLRMNHAISPLENTSLINKSRKDIARMLTVLSQLEQKENK
jgi:ribosomal protein L29